MLGGNTNRLRAVDRALTLSVSVGMILGSVVMAGTPMTQAASAPLIVVTGAFILLVARRRDEGKGLDR